MVNTETFRADAMQHTRHTTRRHSKAEVLALVSLYLRTHRHPRPCLRLRAIRPGARKSGSHGTHSASESVLVSMSASNPGAVAAWRPSRRLVVALEVDESSSARGVGIGDARTLPPLQCDPHEYPSCVLHLPHLSGCSDVARLEPMHLVECTRSLGRAYGRGYRSEFVPRRMWCIHQHSTFARESTRLRTSADGHDVVSSPEYPASLTRVNNDLHQRGRARQERLR
ncbi:hypothetical protein C8Q76DRAFT_414 [Earliella scabrosa]|nr:hypothetical protein C8Q76DRAFT_414 [Earliella scabrosa]